jgi:hypothetical protein
MKASDVRFALFALLVLVAVAGPGPIPGPKAPRGVGCWGSKRVVPKFEPKFTRPTFERPRFQPPVESPSIAKQMPRSIHEPPPRPPSPSIILPVRSTPHVGGPGPELGEAVDPVAPRIEQISSARALAAVPTEVAKKNLPGLENAAQKALEQPTLPAEVRQSLQAVLKESRELAPLHRFHQALESGETQALGGLPKELLPPELRKHLETAITLEELGSVLGNRRQTPRTLLDAVNDYVEKLSGQVTDPVSDEVRLGLAFWARHEGHPEVAAKLLPRGYRLDEGKVVRDLKMLPPEPGAGPGTGEPLPIAGIPIPEILRSPRSGQVELPTKGLPPLAREIERASAKELSATVSKGIRARLKATVGERLNTSWSNMNLQLSPIATHSSRLIDQARRREREEDRKAWPDPAAFADVVKHLGRKLTSAEELMVPDMRRHGKTASQIAEILKKL